MVRDFPGNLDNALGFPFPAAASVRWFGFGGEAAAEVASWPKRESAGGEAAGNPGCWFCSPKQQVSLDLPADLNKLFGGVVEGNMLDIPLPNLSFLFSKSGVVCEFFF